MTKGDREEIRKVVNQQVRLGKSIAAQRKAQLIADGEEQLARIYPFDHEAWKDLVAATESHVRKADRELAKRCEALGIRPEFRPSLHINYSGRGENAVKGRRDELRRVLITRADAVARDAILAIEMHANDVMSVLANDAVESDDARACLARMPTIESLMPTLDVAALAPPGRTS